MLPTAHGARPEAPRLLLRARRSSLCLAVWALCVTLSGCASRRIAFPADPGTPLPDFQTIHAQLSSACAAVRTMTAELSLSGRAGQQRIRGRVVSGFQQPGSMRLEGVAPFGPPAFILVARNDQATLLLPRDNAVLRTARADEILGALTGVTLGPADLQAILTGCVEPAPRATDARSHANGWASIDLAGGAVIYLQRNGTGWHVRGARKGSWEIDYQAWQGRFPSAARLRSTDPAVNVDLTASLAQVETNVDVDAQAFAVSVPASASPITLQELRDNGPLGEGRR